MKIRFQRSAKDQAMTIPNETTLDIVMYIHSVYADIDLLEALYYHSVCYCSSFILLRNNPNNFEMKYEF